MASKTYFYAGYSQGFHHRSDTEAGALAHMKHNDAAFGARDRFVAAVTGSYFPARANDKRGTLARFLLANEVAAAAGTTLPAWIAERTVAATPAIEATVPATGLLVPAGAILVDMLASVASRSHLRSCGSIPTGTTLTNLTAVERAEVDTYLSQFAYVMPTVDVAAPAGVATVEDAAPAEDDETPEQAMRRRIEERAAIRRIRAIGQK